MNYADAMRAAAGRSDDEPLVSAGQQRVPDFPPQHVPRPVKRVHNRHYLQQYFTKRAWNIAQFLVQHFTSRGELVLDPFCGSGVVPTEALVLRRRAYACDINPWAVFITRMTAMAPVDLAGFRAAYDRVARDAFPAMREVAANPTEAERVLKDASYPRDPIPPHIFQTGLTTLDQLFSRAQLGQLVILRDSINETHDGAARDLLRLAFSITLDRANRMYTAKGKSTDRRGQSAPFTLRRYHVWRDPTEIPVADLFESAYRKVVTAKSDAVAVLDGYPSDATFRVWEGSAASLPEWVRPDSVDYVLTDPPYGRNYNYLDLSMMWNAWLGLNVPEEAYEEEAIQGGSRGKGRDEYRALLCASLNQIARVLKPDGWLTLIYSESDMETWSWLLATCRSSDLRYVDSLWSDSRLPTHKKMQSPHASAAGEFYVSFRRMCATRFEQLYGAPLRFRRPEPEEIVRLAIERVIVAHLGASMELVSGMVISRQLLGQDFMQEHGLGELEDIREVLERHFVRNGAGRWQVRDILAIDSGDDPYETLRYALFHQLAFARETGRKAEDIRRSLPDLVLAHGQRLPLGRMRAMMLCFASQGEGGVWHVDDGKVAKFSQLRLFFEKSTIDALRRSLDERASARAARKSPDGLGDLAARLVRRNPTRTDEAVRLALLTEHVSAAVAEVLSGPVAAVSAWGDLAAGDVDLDDLRTTPIQLLVTLRSGEVISEEQHFALAERVTGPVLAEYKVWFHPVVSDQLVLGTADRARLELVVSP